MSALEQCAESAYVVSLNIYVLCVVHLNSTSLTLCQTCDTTYIELQCILNFERSVDQHILYKNNLDGSLIFLNVKCIFQMDFFLFILWKDAKGGPGEEEL